jgi:hypothetical protein
LNAAPLAANAPVQLCDAPAGGRFEQRRQQTVDEAGGSRLQKRRGKAPRCALMFEVGLIDASGMGKKPPVQHCELHRYVVILFAFWSNFFPN